MNKNLNPMRELIQKKSVQLVLGILLVAIWGYNMMSFFNMTTSEEVVRNPEQLTELNLKDMSDSYALGNEYKGNFRDPFSPIIQASQPQIRPQPESNDQPEKKAIPKLTLTGIVEETAIIQNTRQQAVFVTRGDTVEGARVSSVTEDSVVMVFGTNTFTLKFNY